jgi:serine/threonine protein kinase
MAADSVGPFCPATLLGHEFDRWNPRQALKLALDFRRICRFGMGLPSLSDCLFDLSGFRKGLDMSEKDVLSARMYHESQLEIEMVMKSTNQPIYSEADDAEAGLAVLMNLRHPCIAGPIGIIQSSIHGLEIVRSYAKGYSLSKVISVSPEWWTPTVKAKTVSGIVLGLRYAHSLGLIHNHLTTNNVILDEVGMVQITDFCVHGLARVGENECTQVDVAGNSGEHFNARADVQGFAQILSQIVIGSSTMDIGGRGRVPSYVWNLIESELSPDMSSNVSFNVFFETLKQHKFKILEGVDSHEVSQFVAWIEWSEQLTE